MLLLKLFQILSCCCLAVQAAATGRRIRPRSDLKDNGLQNIVQWDNNSLYVHGERVLIMSGEFHPFRLPVPDLWLDILQKIKALGFNCVSFYVDWALLEGKQGDYSAEGIFDFKPLFAAASEAGVYLIARPGPYINAEVSGGGFPGWMQRFKGYLRTPDPEYMNATSEYIKNIGATIAEAQITEGGPVILLQPENEYTKTAGNVKFPDGDYMEAVQKQYRDAGIVVPFISNDASPAGYFAPGQEPGAMDIYGHDGYPLGFDCSNPTYWNDGSIPTDWHDKHLQQSPGTPYSILEFQGGSFDPWGGVGAENCAAYVNAEFERVFNKNNYGMGVTIYNLYMTYGGTNWGNLGHPAGYSSYDYGAAIKEDRTVTREKYSELKLQANSLRASPAYLTAEATNSNVGVYTDSNELTTTALLGKGNTTSFFVVRHSKISTTGFTQYKLVLPSSMGKLVIPRYINALTLDGRDSKIHVVDYDVGGINMLYSTAEVFTWKDYGFKKVLVLFGGPREGHEATFMTTSNATMVEGDDVYIVSKDGQVTLRWGTKGPRKVVKFDNGLIVHLVDRNTAYNYWVLDLADADGKNGNYQGKTSVIVKAGYLLRAASLQGDTLALVGDLNATTTFEVIGAPETVRKVSFNGSPIKAKQWANGVLIGDVDFQAPTLSIPSLRDLEWSYANGLPELDAKYDDSLWTKADKNTTVMLGGVLATPTTLIAGDYGFNTGNQLFRGHFVANGNETTLKIKTAGGAAFGASFWLNDIFLGSFGGDPKYSEWEQTLNLTKLEAGQPATITALLDHMGLDENYDIGADTLKNPRGILDYDLAGREKSAISWKLTGNLGGESYVDRTRGPLNEGGLYPERQGWHLPSPPASAFKTGSPLQGLSEAGVGFYTTSFDLDIPKGYDVPLSFVFTDPNFKTPNKKGGDYRCQLYVNGYQFGKYVNNIGPQTSYPVPEGILNYHGKNYIALSLWALDAEGAKVGDLKLVADTPILTGLGPVGLVSMSSWEKRVGAY